MKPEKILFQNSGQSDSRANGQNRGSRLQPLAEIQKNAVQSAHDCVQTRVTFKFHNFYLTFFFKNALFEAGFSKLYLPKNSTSLREGNR